MAYLFTAASQQSLTMAAPNGVGFDEPLTLSCLFFPTATNQALVSIGPSDNENLGYLIRIGTTSKLTASKNNNATAVTVANQVVSAWNHAAGVFTSNTSRTVYLNGVGISSSTSIAGATGTAFNSMAIGRRHTVSTSPQYSSGRIAEVGVWTAALTADEILSLNAGVSPALVRPQSLVFYAPLVRDLQDVRGGLAITNNNGATVVDHPRIYY